jgi:hypothetical protein
MDNTPEWKGGRIGPYHVGKRYRDIPSDEGRLYAAHNTETGASALVVMPGKGEDWSPRHPWSIRVTGVTSPPSLVLEVGKAPQAEASLLHELTLMLIRLSGAMALIEDREDARAHFTRRPFPSRLRQRVMRWKLVGAGVALATGLTLILWPRPPEDTEQRYASGGVAQAALEESIAFTDTQDPPLPGIIGYPMPEGPFKEQKRPPCIPVTETEIRGGCWTQHKLDAPCPRSTAEYQGKCFMPVKKPDPQPRSIQP